MHIINAKWMFMCVHWICQMNDLWCWISITLTVSVDILRLLEWNGKIFTYKIQNASQVQSTRWLISLSNHNDDGVKMHAHTNTTSEKCGLIFPAAIIESVINNRSNHFVSFISSGNTIILCVLLNVILFISLIRYVSTELIILCIVVCVLWLKWKLFFCLFSIIIFFPSSHLVNAQQHRW